MYLYSVLLVIAIQVVTGTAYCGCYSYYDRKPTSCQDIWKGNSHSRSGIYTLADGDTYCDMDSPCGGGG